MPTETRAFGEPSTAIMDDYAGYRLGKTYQVTFKQRDDVWPGCLTIIRM